MKLALFTPAGSGSSLSRDTLWLEPELLNRGHDLTIVRTEDELHIKATPLPFESYIVHWDDYARVEQVVRESDVLIYQIGNNYSYHLGSLEWMPKHPGVVLLHDYYVADMFRAWAQNHRAEADAVMRAWYDAETVERFFQPTSSEEFMTFASERAPMTEWIAAMAIGVITHSNWAIQRILRACPGPVDVVPVPARPQDQINHIEENSPDEESDALSALSDLDADFSVVTIGHQNRNKRQINVIQALAGSAMLRDRTTYSLVGGIDSRYSQQIVALAQRFGVRVSISGAVDEITMARAVSRADVICCLRYPALESASGSAIEAMIAGKPVIVTDVGFYSELPDTCVLKILPERESEELPLVLERLYMHPEERVAWGTQAAEWARATFSLSNYANRLIDVSVRVQQTLPGLQASRHFADTLARWGMTDATLNDTGALAFLEEIMPSVQRPPAPEASRLRHALVSI